jgi:hypothetical protein
VDRCPLGGYDFFIGGFTRRRLLKCRRGGAFAQVHLPDERHRQWVLLQQRDHAEDQHRLRENQQGDERRPRVRQDDCGNPRRRRYQVDAQHRRALGHPAGDEAVAEVVGVADERTLPARQADQTHHHQVVERHRQHDDRHEYGIPPGPERLAARQVRRAHREHAQQKPDDQADRVAHEDRGGRKVETQEPDQRPQQQRQRTRDEPLLDAQRRREERGGAHRGDTGAEAVHVVEEVEGVGDSGDPEDG